MTTVLCLYLLGWVMTTIGLSRVVRKLNDPVLPQLHPVPLAVTAGAAWPLVLLGAAQIAAIVLVVDAVRRRAAPIPDTAEEMDDDELLASTA